MLSWLLGSISNSQSTAPCIDNDGLGYNLTFTIHYDAYPYELNWTIYEYSKGSWSGASNVILTGDGSSAATYSIMSQSVCVFCQDNYCYLLTIFDSYGDGIYTYGDYGYFTLTLDGVLVTLDKQTFDDDSVYLYFCPRLLDIFQTTDWGAEGSQSSNALKLEMYDIGTTLVIFDVNNSNSDNNTLLWNEFEFRNNILTNVTSVLHLNDGCYYFYFINNALDSADGYISLFWKDLSVESLVSSGNFFLGPVCFYTLYNLTFTIRIDNWPSEVSWQMVGLDDGALIFSGNSYSEADYATITETAVISDGCYRLSLYDSFGDGIYSYGNFGWFNVFLNGRLITFGNQTFDDSQGDFEFCTQLFDVFNFNVQGYDFNNNSVAVTFYDYNSDILITDAHDNSIYYSSDYEFIDYYSLGVTNTLYLNDGCYNFSFTNNVIDSTSGEFGVVINGETIIATTSSTGDKLMENFCIIRGENIYSIVSDYYFNVGENGNFSDSQEFGCTIAGCSVVKQWSVIGRCYNPTLTISIVETDFALSTEEAYIYVNDQYLSSCEPLDEDSSHDWVTCDIADALNLTSLFGSDYLSDASGSGVLKIEIDISSEVNCCGFYPGDGYYYYLYSKAVIKCDVYSDATTPAPTDRPTLSPTPRPTLSPTTSPTARPTLDPDVDIKTLTTTFSHSHYTYGSYFNIIGMDEDVTIYQFEIMCWIVGTYQLTVSMLNELNGTYQNFVGNDPYWTTIYNDSVTCSYSAQKHNVTVGSGDGVPIYGGYKQAFGFEWTGLLIRYNNSFGAIYSQNEHLGITVGAAGVSGSLYYGYVICVTIYYATNTFSTTGSTLIPDSTTSTSQTSQVSTSTSTSTSPTADTTADTTAAPTLTTEVTTQVTSQANESDSSSDSVETTSSATFCDSSSSEEGSEKFEFSIKLDDWPDEVSWSLYEEGTYKEPILQGNGSNVPYRTQINSVACLKEDYCYYLMVNDSYGNGMEHDGDYGWFEFSVNLQSVTLGKQGVGRHGTSVYFCNDMFAGNDADHVVDFTIVTFRDGKVVTISLFDNDNHDIKYINNYFMRDYSDDTRRRRRRRRSLLQVQLKVYVLKLKFQ